MALKFFHEKLDTLKLSDQQPAGGNNSVAHNNKNCRYMLTYPAVFLLTRIGRGFVGRVTQCNVTPGFCRKRSLNWEGTWWTQNKNFGKIKIRKVNKYS